MRITASVVGALVTGMMLAGCGGGGSHRGGVSSGAARRAAGGALTSAPVRVGVVKGAGSVLVTWRGFTLYAYPPDRQHAVTCTGLCADTWPPLTLDRDHRLVGASGLEARLLGTIKEPTGQLVVTYAGWPLYSYVGDVTPGQADGQALDSDGGDWYMVRPDGSLDTAALAG